MPIPTPVQHEDEQKFIGRCMRDEVMLTEYISQAQRLAVCYASWEGKVEKSVRHRLSICEQGTLTLSILKVFDESKIERDEFGKFAPIGAGSGGAFKDVEREYKQFGEMGQIAAEYLDTMRLSTSTKTRKYIEAQEALQSYVISSANLNKSLRNDSGKVPSKGAQLVSDLDKGFVECPKDMVLHRGVGYSSLERLGMAKTFTDHGYLSTSSDSKFALNEFGGTGDVRGLLRIKVPKGSPITAPSGFDMDFEKEVIIGRGAKLKILRRTKQIRRTALGAKVTVYTIDAEVIGFTKTGTKIVKNLTDTLASIFIGEAV